MLELYQVEGCGYFATLREMLTDPGVSYAVQNPRTATGETQNGQTHDQLLKVGGENQIPFLVDKRCGVTMDESEKIGDHLEADYA